MMQHQRSTMCMSFHGTFADARRLQALGAPDGPCPQASLSALRPAALAMVACAQQVAAWVGGVRERILRVLARPAWGVLSLALAVLAMALLMRMAGLPALVPLPVLERPAAVRADTGRGGELDGQARGILAALEDGRRSGLHE